MSIEFENISDEVIENIPEENIIVSEDDEIMSIGSQESETELEPEPEPKPEPVIIKKKKKNKRKKKKKNKLKEFVYEKYENY